MRSYHLSFLVSSCLKRRSFLQNMRKLPRGLNWCVAARRTEAPSWVGFSGSIAQLLPRCFHILFLFLPLCTQDVILWAQNPTCDSRAAGDIRYAHILYTDCYGKDKQNKVHQSEGYGGGETLYLRACQFCRRNPFRIRQKSSAF